MVTKTARSAFRLMVAGSMLLMASAGCSDSASTSEASGQSPAQGAASPQTNVTGSAGRSGLRPLPEREAWDVYYVQGVRVGYGRTTVRKEAKSGQKLLRIEGVTRLVVKRFGQRVEQEVRYDSLETPDGRLLEYNGRMQLGPQPMQTTGRIVGTRLELELSTMGKKTTSSLPWTADCRGPYASEATLLRDPMSAGESRKVRYLVPGFNQIVTTEMQAKDVEPVELLTGSYNLLRIETVTRFPDDQTLKMTIWCDRTGELRKTHTAALQMEAFRTTKAEALDEKDLAELDLGTGTTVRVAKRLPRPHRTRRVRYRIELEDGDPAGVFVSGTSQQVKSIDEHTVEVTVRAVRPGQAGQNWEATRDRPTEDDLRANNLIQSDYPKIVTMAREAVGEEKDPWQIALQLERYVHGHIEMKDFSQALATAAEVAENPVGDCTEHAVLLAALARARGIPARVAIGLVYMQGSQAFGYHMWNEVYIDNRWIPIDATLAGGGIGAAHLKLAHSSLEGASAYTSFLPVVQVIGRLKVEIVEVE